MGHCVVKLPGEPFPFSQSDLLDLTRLVPGAKTHRRPEGRGEQQDHRPCHCVGRRAHLAADRGQTVAEDEDQDPHRRLPPRPPAK